MRLSFAHNMWLRKCDYQEAQLKLMMLKKKKKKKPQNLILNYPIQVAVKIRLERGS